MLQAGALARVARLVRQHRDVDVITFSGYRYETLLQKSTPAGIPELLDLTDVLIDGPYIKALNNGVGLRGSSNQRIIYLTSRLQQYDLEKWPRKMEINLIGNEIMSVGIPAHGVFNSIDAAIRSAVEIKR